MRATLIETRYAEISASEFAWALGVQLRLMKPDPNFPGVDFLGAEIPLEMFAVSEADMRRAVMLATPQALRLSLGRATHRITESKHSEVVSVVLLFRDALSEMFADNATGWLTESLGTFTERLLQKADAINSVRQCLADNARRTAYDM